MSTFEEKVQSQRDIYANLEAIHGKKYADFVKHSTSAKVFANCLPSDLLLAYVTINVALLTDLATAWKINLHDPIVQERMTKDLDALRSAAHTV